MELKNDICMEDNQKHPGYSSEFSFYTDGERAEAVDYIIRRTDNLSH